KLFANGALIVFNSSASPSYIGKNEKRRLLTKSTTMKFNSAYVYVSNNASESTSEVVFSSHLIISEDGKILDECDEITFENKIIYADLDIKKLHFLRRNNSYFKQTQEFVRDFDFQQIKYQLDTGADYVFEKNLEKLPFVPKEKSDLERIAIIQGAGIIKRLDYIGIKKVVIGVSGGLDSTLALLSLCKAFDTHKITRENIIAVTMPSIETSERTYQNAKMLIEKLNCTFKEIRIDDLVSLQLEILGHSPLDKDNTYENIQARLRTNLLMNLANQEKAIMVGTSDMSEIALGWTTFGGDQISMYGLNSGLPKTVVREMIKYYQKEFLEIADILTDILSTPISPELTGSDQLTEEVLGKYEINDFILFHFLVNGDDFERIIYLLQKTFGLDEKAARNNVNNFNQRFFSQQYKRLSTPEGVKIMEISLSPRGEIRLNGDLYPPKLK
ncbi:MAG: NAD(+) synthase, partial [Bacilli bacterium]|nr:NAD(+) synthase [Bacilli bacterium]